jgi:hypothetical protein
MIASLLALSLTALAPAQSAAARVKVGEAKSGPIRPLAARLLPADVAGRIVGGEVKRQWLPGQVYRAIFWEKAESAGPSLCRRRFHGVDLANPAAPGHPDDPSVELRIGAVTSGLGYRTSYPRRASARSCAGDKGWIAPRPEHVEASLTALDRLVGAMRAASRRGPLSFTIACEEESGSKACADRRKTLANLPLDALFGVSFEAQRPAPTAGPSAATLQFGASPPDGKSWRVTLIGTDGRVSEVRMKRTTIIYH